MNLILGNSVDPSEKKRLINEILATIIRSHGKPDLFQHLFLIDGLDIQCAATIVACLNISQRYLFHPKKIVESPGEIYRLFLHHYANRTKEHFLAISIGAAQEVISIKEISVGSGNKAVIGPREVFANALIDRAKTIIIAHNHPSGKIIPSQADIKITKEIAQAGHVVGIPLLDHIVFSSKNYFSFLENRKIEPLS